MKFLTTNYLSKLSVFVFDDKIGKYCHCPGYDNDHHLFAAHGTVTVGTIATLKLFYDLLVHNFILSINNYNLKSPKTLCIPS